MNFVLKVKILPALGLLPLLMACANSGPSAEQCDQYVRHLTPYLGQDVKTNMLAMEQISNGRHDMPIEITNDKSQIQNRPSPLLIFEIDDPKAYTNAGFANARVNNVTCL